jgi:pseudouridine-5'-phosphate glycosidase
MRIILCVSICAVLLKVQSQRTQELHQQNQDNPIIHEQTVLNVINGVGGHQETVTTTSSTPVSSPKPIRKSIAPRFVSPLNGKIVDQGADVILDAIIDGKCKHQLSDASSNVYSCVNKESYNIKKEAKCGLYFWVSKKERATSPVAVSMCLKIPFRVNKCF